MMPKCKYGDPFCPCQDGDQCHYEGKDAWPIPKEENMEDEREETLQDLALKLDLANMELATIDGVLARRPALAGLKHRTEKIERMCQVNGELLKLLVHITNLLLGHTAYLETCEGDVILENLPGTVAYLRHEKELVEAAIRKAIVE